MDDEYGGTLPPEYDDPDYDPAGRARFEKSQRKPTEKPK